MRTFYRSHSIEVNTLPNSTIVFDIFNRSRQPLLTGFSLTDPNEQTVMDRMRAKVDDLILEPPVRMGMHVRD